jgi:hypothetical protein
VKGVMQRQQVQVVVLMIKMDMNTKIKCHAKGY